ncbi:hypothetical protein [Streptomyces canus]|uniref:hypothetical protein n=1 Tax=Streptomyces canus TaxID=58343 RepID=UPI002E35DAD0|nr:hypothetical protein [Streptomyces canus]
MDQASPSLAARSPVLWNYPTPGALAHFLGIVVLVLALLGILAAASGTADRRSPAPGDAVRRAPGLS